MLGYYQQAFKIARATGDGQAQERQFVENFNLLQDQAIQIGKQLRQLRQIPASERTSQQEQQIIYIDPCQ